MERVVEYEAAGVRARGFVACRDESEERRPVVVIAHAWRGLDDFAKDKARALAALGYIGFAADLYGEGRVAHSDEEATALMTPLFLDRTLLAQRIRAAFVVASQQPGADPDRVGAIGFCFGGMTVVELVRSGAPVRGGVCFHGALGNERGGERVRPAPLAPQVPGALLLLQGRDDPLATVADLTAVTDELTHAGVDWQLHLYGHVAHAFTNPQASDTVHGLVYNARAAQRSWMAMQNFFQELFN